MKFKREKLEKRIERYKVKYIGYVEKEQTNQAKTQIKKHEFVPGIDYIWITFKNNDIPSRIIETVQPQSKLSKCCKRMFCIDNTQNDRAEF